ncbi:MAG: alpha/beta hydrolase [Gammaproteobacteria bacterium]|nr:alpha/beta hydrolase [Gammaproteobacteria bacterium]
MRMAMCALLPMLASCATPQVQPRLPPQIAPTLEAAHAVMADGYRLPFTVWRPAGEVKAVVLALHGMNDYRNAFATVGPYLAGRGIATYAYDQRGFGQTRWAGLWPATDRLVDDLRTMAALLHAEHPGQPLYLMGESMGGAVILASQGQSMPPGYSGALLIAPAVWGRTTMHPAQRALLWLAAHTVPGWQVSGKALDILPSDNQEMLKALGRDPLVIKKTRIDVLYGISQLMDDALAAAPRLNGPALILYGVRDEIIPRAPVCRLLSLLPQGRARQWRAVVYSNGYHMLTRDLQADVVLADIAAWLDDPASPLPSGEELNEANSASSTMCRQGSRE